jgi:hypothetical protein
VALITATQLASHMQRDLDSSSANLAIESATGLILDVTGPIEETESTITLPIGSDGYVHLPMTVVTAVDSVLVGGQEVLFTWEQPFPRLRLDSWTGLTVSTWPTAEVTLTHGYATVPGVVKAVALGVAARIFDNPQGLRSRQIDDYSETRAGEDDTVMVPHTLTPLERTALEGLNAGAYVTRS